jgi:hypothetical protein
VLGRASASSRMAYERRVLAGFFGGDTKRPTAPRGEARDVRVWLAPRRRRTWRPSRRCVIAWCACSRLPSGLPGAFASAWSRFATPSCSAAELGRASASACMAYERRVLAGFFKGDTKRPGGQRGEARDVRVWFAPRRSGRRGACVISRRETNDVRVSSSAVGNRDGPALLHKPGRSCIVGSSCRGPRRSRLAGGRGARRVDA